MFFTTTRTNGGKTRFKICGKKIYIRWKMRSCAKRKACLVAFCQSLGLGCVFFSFSPWLWSLNSKPIFPLACVDLSLEAQGRKGQEKLQTLLTTAAACLGGGVSQGDGGQQHLGVEVTLKTAVFRT